MLLWCAASLGKCVKLHYLVALRVESMLCVDSAGGFEAGLNTYSVCNTTVKVSQEWKIYMDIIINPL